MRACHAHVLNPHLLFFSLSPVSLSLEGFLGPSATDDFDLIILLHVYILIILLPDTFLNLLKEYFISSVLFHLSKLIKQLLFDIINLPQNSKGSCFMNKLYNKEMDIAIGLNDFFSQT